MQFMPVACCDMVKQMKSNEVVHRLKALANPKNVAGMARFGIASTGTLGVSVVEIRNIARQFLAEHRKDLDYRHRTADQLWQSGIHEARILAALIDVPELVTELQMEAWVADFDSWDVCDQVCSNLFDKTAFAYDQAKAWAGRPEEFVRRAAFTMMACLSVHDKKASDQALLQFLPYIKKYSGDDRNFVKKAVNWALRQIGKRSKSLHAPAVLLAEELAQSSDKTARWIGKDAVRELKP